MRLAVCALSAVLLSGCSWLGGGSSSSNSFGANGFSSGGAYDINCAPGYAGYGAGQYGGGFGAGAGACGPAGGYGVANGYGAGAGFGGQGFAGQGFGDQGYAGAGYGAGYGGAALAANGIGAGGFGPGAGGFGAGGFGPGAGGFGAGGINGASGFGAGGFGPGAGGFVGNGFAGQGFAGNGFGPAAGFAGATVLGANAPFGVNAGGNVVGTQFNNGQFVQGAGVQTVQGAPVYVPQPYPAYYGVPQLRGVSAAAPLGFGLSVGTEFPIGGDFFSAKGPGIALGSNTVNTGGTDGISYGDAFDQAITIGGTAEYDVSPNTTVLGGVSYTHAGGDTAEEYQTVDARSPGTLEPIDATFSDLDLVTVEGGVRRYVGNSRVLRPYVAAKAGITYNSSVDVHRTYSSDGADFDPAPFEYAEDGWNPTAAALYGVEMAVGPRTSIGLESGIRWRDDFDTSGDSQDSWSIPLSLRGRVAF